MPLVLYGSARSRTMRVLWMAEELGIEFEHIPYEFDDPALKQDAFRKLNPAGAVPTLIDDGYALSESLAINLYLAKRHAKPDDADLYARSAQEEASMWQWSLWVQGHVEPWIQKDAYLAEVSAALGDVRESIVRRSLDVLERALMDSAWLVGERFTVADLNVASVLSPSRANGLDMTRHPQTAGWLARCYGRPAAVTVRERAQRDD